MPNEIDVLVQAEMAGAGLNADQENLVHAMVEEERKKKGCELEPAEALAVVRLALEKVMEIEVGVDANVGTEPSSDTPAIRDIIGMGIVPFPRKPGPSRK